MNKYFGRQDRCSLPNFLFLVFSCIAAWGVFDGIVWLSGAFLGRSFLCVCTWLFYIDLTLLLVSRILAYNKPLPVNYDVSRYTHTLDNLGSTHRISRSFGISITRHLVNQ